MANEGLGWGFPSLKKCHVILVVISILGGGVDPRSTLNQITPAMGSYDPTEPFPSEWLVSMRPLPSSSMRLMRVVPNEREELPGITGGGEEVLLGAWDDGLGMMLFSYIFIISHRKIDIQRLGFLKVSNKTLSSFITTHATPSF